MVEIEYRPEQMFAVEILKKTLPENYQITLEKEVTDLKTVDHIMVPFCKPDIVLIDTVSPTKIAIRINGSYHDKDNQRMKDMNQRIVLEGNGWKVVDFNYREMPNLFFGHANDSNDYNKAVYEVLQRLQFIW